MGLLQTDAPTVSELYPRHDIQDIAPIVEEYLPAAHKRQEELEVEKYEPAAQGAKAVMIINPLPPFPLLDAWPGNPPTPTPDTYPFIVFILYVGAWPEVLPEVPAKVDAEPSWMQPPMNPLPPAPLPVHV